MTAQECRAQMMGHRWQGTVADETTGVSGSYDWRCSNVMVGIAGDVHILLDGDGWQDFCRDEKGLGDVTVDDLVKQIGEALEAEAQAKVQAEPFGELIGEAL